MFGDTHGSEDSYRQIWTFLEGQGDSPGFDWLGLEMLTVDRQTLLDAYTGSEKNSEAFREAETELLAIFEKSWNNRFGYPEAPEENHYFRLIRWARGHGVRVIALDAVGEYTLYRYGEFPLGSTVRNMVWADAVPLSGKGVIFGGSAHFVPLPATPYTFQDYVKKRDPGMKFFLVR
jgi:hypothetical protein